ncbi:ABC transporter substrate-binding protein [Haloterrigena salifodinae]|uniref:ABC transporter substrate-binding protein n=1 Tax=Haloterrigena salifodinae TaxID=2675099 RepID=UPI000F88B597|nr:ABC transporter substrate-binding protein [Haloterrigena salifodinae]
MDRIQRLITGAASDQLSITILTLPTDNDRQAIKIARQLEENLKAVGINVRIEPRADAELLQTVLLEHDFDCYISRHPGGYDPDFLYETFHSKFAPEAGWQNPYGFVDTKLDELLERQRSTTGSERKEAIGEALDRLAQTHPIVPICVPDERRLVRTDRFDGWDDHHLGTRLGYLGLEPDENDFEDEVVLNAVITDSSPSRNINPLAAAYRYRGPFIDLLYDSVATRDDDELRPWLAESWEWDESVATITLRSNCLFHDGEPVTADDVKFTYDLLDDTSLGDRDGQSPAPRYRGVGDAVESVTAVDDRTVRMRFGTSDEVGELAFTVPILPKHIWKTAVKDRLENGAEPIQGTWDLVTTEEIPPIGSGPFALTEQEPRSHLRFERFDDHFTRRGYVDLPEPRVDEIAFHVEPNSSAAVDQLEAGNADVTGSILGSETVGDVPDGLELVESESWTFYHIGFNVRNSPFSNLHFRRNVARLIDRESLVADVFNEQASPTVTPVTGEWIPDDLEWDGSAPYAPFFRDETNSGDTGELDIEQAKREFERHGFQYDEDGEYIVRS